MDHLNERLTNEPHVTYIIEKQRTRSAECVRDVIRALNLLEKKQENADALRAHIAAAYHAARCMDTDAEDIIALLLYRTYRENRLTYREIASCGSEVRGREYYDAIVKACGSVVGYSKRSEQERIAYSIMMHVCDKMFDALLGQLNERETSHTVYQERAYTFARDLHAGRYGDFGEPYLVHTIRVAEILADVGIENKIIAAAFLYEAVEAGLCTEADIEREFGNAIAHYVHCLVLVDREFESTDGEGNVTELDARSLERLYRMIAADRSMIYALYIKAADKIHDLKHHELLSDAGQQRSSRTTQLNYLPVFRHFGLDYFVSVMDDLVWRTADTRRYDEMQRRYRALLARNHLFTEELTSLLALYLGDTFGRYTQMFGTIGYDVEVNVREYRPLELYGYLKRGGRREVTPAAIHKRNIPICDINLILEPRDVRATTDTFVAAFVKMFKDYIATTKRVITDFSREGDAFIFVVEDRCRNVYRLCISMRDDYMRACLGNGEGFVVREQYEETLTRGESISIQLQNNTFITLPKGASVIDAAFAIHEDVGCCVKAALVNGHRVSVFHLLQEGDKVTIEADTNRPDGEGDFYIPHVRLNWLNAAVTKRARMKIVAFLEDRYERDDAQIVQDASDVEVDAVSDRHIITLRAIRLPD